MFNLKSNPAIEAIASAVIIGLLALVIEKLPEGMRTASFWLASLFCLAFFFLPHIWEAINIALEKHYAYKQNLAQTNQPESADRQRILHSLYSAQHTLIHGARDVAVKFLPRVPKYSDLIPNRPGAQLPGLEVCERTIGDMLAALQIVFKNELPPGTKVWTCLRDRRSGDVYSTWLRFGEFSKNREHGSRPMHKDTSYTILDLRRYYKENCECVMITGQDNQRWEKQKNDGFGEDRSVLMGSVMTRSYDPSTEKWENNCQSWILCVNTDKPNSFSDHHIKLMQAYVDVFSWLANTMLRSAARNG